MKPKPKTLTKEQRIDCEKCRTRLQDYIAFKNRIFGQDYYDPKTQSSYSKLRHHLDQLISHMQDIIDKDSNHADLYAEMSMLDKKLKRTLKKDKN